MSSIRHKVKAGAEAGFTLIEILVAIALLAVLAAIVVPTVIQQIGEADPVRVSDDLGNIRSGIELFQVDIRSSTPGELEHLVNDLTSTEVDVEGNDYSTGEEGRWAGPYMDATIDQTTTGAVASGVNTGFDGEFCNLIVVVDGSGTGSAANWTGVGSNATVCTSVTRSTNIGSPSSAMAAVSVEGLDHTEWERVNEQVDGTGESDAENSGRVRWVGSGTSDTDTGLLFYLAVPII